jgi:hypothetical protein
MHSGVGLAWTLVQNFPPLSKSAGCGWRTNIHIPWTSPIGTDQVKWVHASLDFRTRDSDTDLTVEYLFDTGGANGGRERFLSRSLDRARRIRRRMHPMHERVKASSSGSHCPVLLPEMALRMVMINELNS